MENVNYMYLCPGDVVKVRHNIENVPLMFVTEKVNRTIRNRETGDTENLFVGIKCR